MHVNKCCVWCVIAIVGMSASAGLHENLRAQTPPAEQPRTDPRIPVPSDTGRAVTGYQTYVRYETPSECAEAIGSLKQDLRAWSGLAHDTLPFSRQIYEHDPAAVVVEARRCASRFTAAMTAPQELPFLLPITVLLGDSVQARAVIDRQLALESDESGKAAVLIGAMQEYLNARPIQLALAAKVLARFDTVAPTRLIDCIQAHEIILKIANSVFDRAWMRRELATLRPLIQKLPLEQRNEAVSDFYSATRTLWLWEYGPDSAAKLMATLLKEIPHTLSAHAYSQAGQVGLDILGRAYVGHVGQTAPPIPISSWSPAPTGTYPGSGHTTLIVFLTKDFLRGPPVATSARAPLREMRAMLMRLHAKYGDRGLRILFISPSGGFSPPNTEEERFKLTTQWFAAQFPFPVIVGDHVEPFHTLPAPDGRRVGDPSKIDTDPVYGGLRNFPFKLVGPNGKFLWEELVPLPRYEAELDAFIRQGVGLPPSADTSFSR